jgi:beta-lactamase class A
MNDDDALRRRLVTALPALLLLPCVGVTDSEQGRSPNARQSFELPLFAALEQRSGGRLGACVLDTASGAIAGHRLDERFALCSTFKLALAAIVLRRIDQHALAAEQIVAFGEDDLVPYAPVTGKHLAHGGMTVLQLARAAQVHSDNVAANLLLGLIGGPTGFTEALRSLGDTITRLDRVEPALNYVLPGDPRDTTTPRAMARTVSRLLTGDALSADSRALLIEWMQQTQTGTKRLRAGLPADWKSGDKTGTGGAGDMANQYNDIAVAWPPASAPIIITAYYETTGYSGAFLPEHDAVLAQVGRIAVEWARARHGKRLAEPRSQGASIGSPVRRWDRLSRAASA